MGHDLRLAVRGLYRDSAYTFTAVITLALTMALNVTAFAVMRTILVRGFPLVQENQRLVYVQEQHPRGGCCLAYPDYEEWRAQATSFSALAFVAGRTVTLEQGSSRRSDDLTGAAVSSHTFALLGVRPLLGRDFVPSDEGVGAPAVTILSYPFWQARFGGRREIVGEQVRLDGVPTTIVGVMPPRFAFPSQQALWMPVTQTPEFDRREPRGYLAVGRLAPGATVDTARVELEAINRRLAAEYPATNRGVTLRVNSHSRFFMGPDAAIVYGSVWGATWFLLLIACANLANLTLARTAGRSREFATRLALGAGRWRLTRWALTEGVLLTGLAAVLAWNLGLWSVRTWAAATESQYQVLDYAVGWDTVLYLSAIAAGAALVIGLVPIVRIWQLSSLQSFRPSSRGATQGRRGKQLSAALVTVQMSLAMVLLSGTGVLVKSFVTLVTADVGLHQPERVLIGWVSPPKTRDVAPEQRAALYTAIRETLAAMPGVETVALASTFPVNVPGKVGFDVNGTAEPTDTVVTVAVSPGYFKTVGASTDAGRDFTPLDTKTSPVAIVNERFAATYWPGQDPVGKRIRLYRRSGEAEWHTIVGVSTNVMQGEPTRQRFLPIVYVPFDSAAATGAGFLMRMREPAAGVAPAVERALRTLDPELRVDEIKTLQASLAFRADRMDIEHVEMGKHAAVAPIFATIALVMAAVGLYAVVLHTVTQRTREIGVRMAIGAAGTDIRRLVMRDGMRPVVIGIIVAAPLSVVANRVLQSQLVGVSPFDPVTLVLAAALLAIVAFVGCDRPARRAMRVDPVVCLQHAGE